MNSKWNPDCNLAAVYTVYPSSQHTLVDLPEGRVCLGEDGGRGWEGGGHCSPTSTQMEIICLDKGTGPHSTWRRSLTQSDAATAIRTLMELLLERLVNTYREMQPL